MKTSAVFLLPFLFGCVAQANTPPAPFAAFANACKTFTTGARLAIVHSRNQQDYHNMYGHYVLRMNAQGQATLDSNAVRFSWSPNQVVVRDSWSRTPEDWTRIGGSALPGRIQDVWNSCRAGFSDWTWSTPVQAYSEYTVTATLPYAWATGMIVELSMLGTTAGSLSELRVFPPGVATERKTNAVLHLGFQIVEFNVQLAPNALNPDLPDGVKSPIPWVWYCSDRAEVSCFERTGWAPAGTMGPLFN